jgi:hypothetical protein
MEQTYLLGVDDREERDKREQQTLINFFFNSPLILLSLIAVGLYNYNLIIPKCESEIRVIFMETGTITALVLLFLNVFGVAIPCLRPKLTLLHFPLNIIPVSFLLKDVLENTVCSEDGLWQLSVTLVSTVFAETFFLIIYFLCRYLRVI